MALSESTVVGVYAAPSIFGGGGGGEGGCRKIHTQPHLPISDGQKLCHFSHLPANKQEKQDRGAQHIFSPLSLLFSSTLKHGKKKITFKGINDLTEALVWSLQNVGFQASGPYL